MLKLIMKGYDTLQNCDVVHDIDAEFSSIEVKDTETNRRLIKGIDNATLIDSKYIKDRFGCKLSINDLSTSCKAALLLCDEPDKIIDLSECGYNAVQVILRSVKNGTALIEYNPSSFGYTSEENKEKARSLVKDHKEYRVPIDVYNDEYKFSSLDRLAYYLENEKPLSPDMEIPGIEKISAR